MGSTSPKEKMSKPKKQVFSKVKAVKANARARVGSPPPERTLPDPKQQLAAAVLTTAPAKAQPIAQTIQVNKDNRTIAITATDKVIVMADTATVHIGFIAYGPDSDAASAARSPLSNAIVKALTAAGVPSDAIQSENQNVAPVQEYQIDKLTPAEKAQRKFQVVQSWTVRTPADDAAKILDLAVKAG